jgi:hypothetical protein
VSIREMNPTLHWVQSASLVPLSDDTGCSLFNIRATYVGFAHEQIFQCAHVPRRLAPHFERGVRGFHLEILERNRGATISLGNHPHFLVVGVIDNDGISYSEIPGEWSQRRVLARILLWCCLASLLVLVFVEHQPAIALGAGLTYLAMFAARAVREVTASPFSVSREVGRRSSLAPLPKMDGYFTGRPHPCTVQAISSDGFPASSEIINPC